MDKTNEKSPTKKKDISMLPEDCLAKIFTYLSFVERIKIQRVCKQWEVVSKRNWHDFQVLRILDPGIILDSDSFKKLLDFCGKFLRTIEFYASNVDSISVMGSFLKHVKEKCPNLDSLIFSRIDSSNVEYLSHNFTDLKKLIIYSCLESSEDHFYRLFQNNENLKILSLTSVNITGRCLLGLVLKENIESFEIDNCQNLGLNSFLYVLKNLNKLNYLNITSSKNLLGSIGTVLESVTNKTNMKFLKISQGSSKFTKEITFSLNNFKNLQKLHLCGKKILTNKLLFDVADNCRNLKQLHLEDSMDLTGQGLTYLNSLSKLQKLSIKNLHNVGNVDSMMLSSLNYLECYNCNISNKFITNILNSSKSLEEMKILMCDKISIENDSEIQKLINRNEKLKIKIIQ